MRKFSEILDSKLIEHKRSSAWLASELGVADGTIRNYRKGSSEPDISLALRIAKLLDFNLAECFGPGEVKEAQGQYQVKKDDDIDQILRREGMIEVPLFPTALDLLSASNQSKQGSIDLKMAKGTLLVIERLAHAGVYAAKVDELFDCDDNFEYIVIWPWEKAVKQGQSILFTSTPAKELFVRKVLVYSKGRFVFQNPYNGNLEVEESSINVLGLIAGRFESMIYARGFHQGGVLL